MGYAIAILGVLFGVAIAILLLKDKASKAIWRRRNPPEKLEAARRLYQARLLKPDWAFYERHLGRPIPQAIVALFGDAERLSSSYRFGDYFVAFAPLDAEGMTEAEWVLPGIVPFANSDGDPIFLRSGTSERDAVFIAYHDGGGTDELAPSIETFLSQLQHAA
jgi:hypothetical protein